MCIVDEWWQMRWNVDVQYREDVMLRCWQCRESPERQTWSQWGRRYCWRLFATKFLTNQKPQTTKTTKTYFLTFNSHEMIRFLIFFYTAITTVLTVPINATEFNIYRSAFDPRYEDLAGESIPTPIDCPDGLLCDETGSIVHLRLYGLFTTLLSRFNSTNGFGLPKLTTIEFEGSCIGNKTIFDFYFVFLYFKYWYIYIFKKPSIFIFVAFTFPTLYKYK